jgi:DNA-binding response OmpR family regulator
VRILVVEDDTRLAAALQRGLEADGFAVDLAADGSDGLWLATEVDYDVIVCDVLLPGLDGFDVCSRLRASGCWTPILMLTALDGELDEAGALDCGADDYLCKPFSYRVLLARLRALIRRGHGQRPAVLVAGDLRLDPAAHQVWRGSTPVPLSARQFSLLEYLLSRAGDVIPKAQILEHVWDFAFGGDGNIVEVYVGQLRRRIDEPFGRQAITTVRRVGYRLDPDGG